jgi:hypothetical protein
MDQKNYEKERWEWIPSYKEVYEISTRGNVRSYVNAGGKKLITPIPRKIHFYANRKKVSFINNGIISRKIDLWNKDKHSGLKKISELMLITFVKDKPEGHVASYISGNYSEDRLDNLYWAERPKNIPCTKCLEILPFTVKFFIVSKKSAFGLDRVCKKCTNTSERDRRNADPFRKDRAKAKYSAADPIRQRARILRQGMINRSRKFHIPFEREVFTIDFMVSMINATPNCLCCDKILDFGRKKLQKAYHDSPSMDRLIPELGYISSNTFLICYRCNWVKNNSSAQELLKVANYILSNQPVDCPITEN